MAFPPGAALAQNLPIEPPDNAGSQAGISPGLGAPPKTGCVGTAAGVNAIILCDEAVHSLSNQTGLDVVRSGYGTTINADHFAIPALHNSGGQTGTTSGYFSPISVFSDTQGFYGPAIANFRDTTVGAPPQSGLAMITVSTGGVINLGPNFVLNQQPGTAANVRQAGLAPFGGGTILATGITIDMPIGIVYGLQITNSGSGGGLPSSTDLASVTMKNSDITVGNGDPSPAVNNRSYGAWVRGEASLQLTDSHVTAGNYSAGVYNRWAPTDQGLIQGSRSILSGVTVNVGSASVGLWASGDPSRLEAKNTTVKTGPDSWGAYSSSGGTLIFTDTSIAVADASIGAGVNGAGSLTATGGEISAPAANSIAVELDGAVAATAATFSGSHITTGGDAFLVSGSDSAIVLNNATSATGTTHVLNIVNDSRIDVTATDSKLTGSAVTQAGSVSNLTLTDNSLWTMTGSSNLTRVVNDPSLIQYAPPVGDPHVLASYKTLTVVNYVGQGGRIGLNTFLGDDTSPSDRLVINGGTATGRSLLHIANTAGTGALTTGNGIEVVSAINGATTSAGAFALGNVVAAGPYEYLLFRGGVTPGTEDNWYLRNESGPVPPAPPDPTPPEPTPDPPPTPAPTPHCIDCPTPPEPHPYYRMEAPLYSKITLLARQVGLLLLDTFHERQGDQYLLQHDAGAVWGRLIGVGLQQKFTGPLVPSFTGSLGAVQIGSDVYVFDNRQDRLGGFASYAHAAGTVRGTILDDDDELGGHLPEDVITLGGYFTHIDSEKNWYLDAVVMGSWIHAYPLSERGIGTSTTGTGITASLEGGYPLVLGDEWTLEPMAQIVFNTMSFASSSDPFTTLDYNPADTWYGRLGARLEYDTAIGDRPAKPFVEINVWHGFGGTDVTVYNGNIPVPIPFGNTDVEAALGITTQASEGAALTARIGYLTNLQGNYQQALKGQFGLRYVW